MTARDRLDTLTALFRESGRAGNRRHFVVVVVLVLAGLIVALGAAFPFLSPFLYTLF